MEKPIGFWLRTGGTAGSVAPTIDSSSRLMPWNGSLCDLEVEREDRLTRRPFEEKQNTITTGSCPDNSTKRTKEKDKIEMTEDKKENTDLRVTAIVGAGAALEITGMNNHHSTAAITRAVLNPTPRQGFSNEFYANQKRVTNEIFYHLLREYNHRNIRRGGMLPLDDAYKLFHFEVIYHIIETLYSYDYFWSGTSVNENERPPIVDFIGNKLNLNWQELFRGHKSYITTIMDIVNEYNESYINNITDANNAWYKAWWSNAQCIWDVFTLNYDTTIEDSLNKYEDGFEPIEGYDFSRFNPKRLLHSTADTINHIHGCILYGLATYKSKDINRDADSYDFRDLYKHATYDKAMDCWLGRGINDEKYQSLEREFFSPIITGMRKTDKILHLPLAAYRYNLENKIMQNRSLVVIGYSFGDTYVNDVINRMRLYHGDDMRVVLIDYKPTISPKYLEFSKKTKDYTLGRALHNAFPVAGSKMISRIMNIGFYGESHFAQYKDGQPIISSNGQFMCCYNGFREAIENHMKEICDFLNS